MTFTRQSIGPKDPRYKNSGFTEILVAENGQEVCHFSGPFARVYSTMFLVMKEQHYSKSPELLLRDDSGTIESSTPVLTIVNSPQK